MFNPFGAIYEYFFGKHTEMDCNKLNYLGDALQSAGSLVWDPIRKECVSVDNENFVRFLTAIPSALGRLVGVPGKAIYNGLSQFLFWLIQEKLGLEASTYGLVGHMICKITYQFQGLLGPGVIEYGIVTGLIEVFLVCFNLCVMCYVMDNVLVSTTLTAKAKAYCVAKALALTFIRSGVITGIQDLGNIPVHKRLRGGGQILKIAAQKEPRIARIMCLDLQEDSNPLVKLVSNSEVIKQILFDFHFHTRLLN